MHYLIDGYNLLFRLVESKKSLQTQRQTIILSLQKEFKILRLEGTVVFDGSHQRGEHSGLSYHSPLIIAYSHSGQSADQYILEKVESSSAISEITVVTDDGFLASAARTLGAHTLSLKSFIARLEKKNEQRRKTREEGRDQRPFKESRKDFERLLKIFEERLQNKEEFNGL